MKFVTTVADTPQEMPPLAEGFETWRICEPKAALDFSATGYFFGINLQPHIDVPVGLIQTCVGGTPAEAWTPREVLEGNPEYQDILDMWQEIIADYPSKKAKYEAALAAWKKGGKQGRAPKLTKLGPDNHRQPYALYNGMIAPIHPFPIKGAVWYQGEANAHTYERVLEYRSLLPDMIESWRARWGLGDFPFIWVQLAPFHKIMEAPQDKPWSWMRETMDKMQGVVPNGGMACIIDGGSQSDIHPPYKEMAGSRLALQARRVAYGQDVIASGPVLKSSERAEGKIKLTFENVGDGLEQRALVLDAGKVDVPGDRLVGFTLCGEDHVFVRAEAKITGKDTVEVWSENIEEPVAVRYAWAEFPLANLYNSAGFPTGPFRTDNFPPPMTEQ
jgi:sialate O-acetylesterase